MQLNFCVSLGTKSGDKQLTDIVLVLLDRVSGRVSCTVTNKDMRWTTCLSLCAGVWTGGDALMLPSDTTRNMCFGMDVDTARTRNYLPEPSREQIKK